MKKKVLTVTLILAVALAGYLLTGSTANAKKHLTFNGIAYIAGHGGHFAIIDLRTMKSPSDIMKDRIVITESGSEMEGIIAGMKFEDIKKGGGTHGGALLKSGSDKRMVIGTLSGDVYVYHFGTGKKEGPFHVGKKFCDAILGPDGNVYLEDMADGHVYVWDPKKLKTVDSMPIGKAICGIQWTHDTKKAYMADMPTGTIYVYDWTTKKKIKEIKDPEMTFIHQIQLTPDGKELWVSAPNEFDPGLKPGTHHSQVVIIDTATDTVKDHIVLPDNIRPHDFEFTPDGKYALAAARTYENDSLLVVINTKTHKIEEKVSACYSCHSKYGIEVTIDQGSPLLCGIEVDWNPAPLKKHKRRVIKGC